ncbi:hypothetical protein A8U91_02750 [Halomonas elongata]|uniref:Uncharacterized protein n=1 Tax=Halomonas elongata TaxID=2746 RepID=A0A1B8NUM2_HALEL|nr:hypothetical protein A8U91_02750 [Halomonas elongata]
MQRDDIRESPEDFHAFGGKGDLFPGFAQGGGQQVRVVGLALSAREGDLATMSGEVRGAAG